MGYGSWSCKEQSVTEALSMHTRWDVEALPGKWRKAAAGTPPRWNDNRGRQRKAADPSS